MTLILDAGAFIAIERSDRSVMAMITREQRLGRQPRTHGGIVAQVWRGGSGRQYHLRQALAATHVDPLDAVLGRQAGALLAAVGAGDAIDAAVVALARPGDQILTSDPRDIADLAATTGFAVDVVGV